MIVRFVTPTRLSLIDLTTMGDSSKRGDSTKIGQFCSGLKYAVALLLRHNVKIYIWVDDGIDGIQYTFESKSITDGHKSKEIIRIIEQKLKGRDTYIQSHDTGFALQLGYNWDLWMSFRELASNTIDEGGYFTDRANLKMGEEGTTIVLDFEADSDFAEVWKNRDLYVNQLEPKYKLDNVDVLINPDGYLKIYKQDILVHSDKNVKSRWAYNIHFGELDERRILLDLSYVKTRICESIATAIDPVFISELVSRDQQFVTDEFIWDTQYVYSLSSAIIKRAYDLVDFHTLRWIDRLIRKRPDCQLPGREVTTLQDSYWTASKSIKLETVPTKPITELTFKEKVLQKYRLDIGDLEIQEADMLGGKCFADKFNKCLIISKDFDIQRDMPEFVIQYFDYIRDRRESLLTVISNEYCKLIVK